MIIWIVLIFESVFTQQICAQRSVRNPDISYCFLTKSGSSCQKEKSISASRFTFGQNLSSGIVDVDDPEIFPHDVVELVLSCTHSTPIRWLARKPLGDIKYRGRSVPQIIGTFQKRIVVNLKASHFSRLFRCETFAQTISGGKPVASELYLIVNRSASAVKFNTRDKELRSTYWFHALSDQDETWNPRDNSKQVIIPCVANSYLGNFNYLEPQNRSDSFDDLILIKKDSEYQKGEQIEFDRRNYDLRIGVRVEDADLYRSVYECRFPFPGYKEEMTPIIGHANNYLEPTHLQFKTDGAIFTISCDAGRYSDVVSIKFGPCNSLLECELMWAPVYPILFREYTNDATVPQEQNHRNNISFNPGYYHGFVHCFGVVTNPTLPEESYVVSQSGYIFTDLDGNAKFLNSSSNERQAVMKLKLLNPYFQKTNTSMMFQCNISTFLLEIESLAFEVQFKNADAYVCRNSGGLYNEELIRESGDEMRAIGSWRLIFPLNNNVESVTCSAQYVHKYEFREEKITISSESSPVSESRWIITICVLSVVIGILTCALIVFWRKYHKADDPGVYKNFRESGRSAADELAEICRDFDFDPEKKIKAKNLKTDSEILSDGNFGIVYKGEFKNFTVAIKSPQSSPECFKMFLNEIIVMSYLGEHNHIVKFLGAVVDEIKLGKATAVLEFSPHGSLQNYLKAHAESYSEYEEMEPSVRNLSPKTKVQLNRKILYSFCRQIASAMEFLAEKRVIHCDVALRNVFVFDNGVVKITDFALSARLEDDSESTTQSGPLPWRWMALESLRHYTFSTKSDVWSYGVTMWEIFMLGEVPYPGISWSNEFADHLANGLRLLKPPHALDNVYAWMMRCWLNDPESRPTFTECKMFFVGMRFIPKRSMEHYETAC